MSREPIIGSGFKGPGFEQKGFRERNLQLLLDTLSKKETQKAIEALAKIDKDEWVDMSKAATQLNSFLSLGGIEAYTAHFTKSIKDTIKLQIESILSPLTNEINQAITDLLTPFINDLLTPLINDLNTFISENKTGAAIGGIVGSIASMFLPGGPILVAIGAVIGAWFEALLDPFLVQSTPEALAFAEWLAANPGGTYEEFLISQGAGVGGGPQEGF